MPDVIRVVLFVLGVVLMMMIAKVAMIVVRPNSRLGEYNRIGRVLLLCSLLVFTGASNYILFDRLGGPLTWRAPVLGAGMALAAAGVYYTFVNP